MPRGEGREQEAATTAVVKSAADMEQIAKTAQVVGDHEVGSSGTAMMATAQVQAAMVVAQNFPRDEDAAFGKIIRSCRRSGFAENVEYRFPRGGKQVSGPSVYLMREIAKAWGNIEHGFDVTEDTDERRVIVAYAWDLQSNTRVRLADSFKKLQQRKVRGETQWVVPDERDLRELTNRRGAILVRECIRGLIPQDYVDDAVAQARKTLRAGIEADPDGARKKIIAGFDTLNIKAEALKAYLGIPLEQASPAQLADLRSIFESIRDGNSSWSDYVRGENGDGDGPAKTGTLDPSKLKPAAEGEDALTEAEQEAVLNLRKVAREAGVDPTEINEWLKKEVGTNVIPAIPRSKFEAVTEYLAQATAKAANGAEAEEEDDEEEPFKPLSSAAVKRIAKAAKDVGLDDEALPTYLAEQYGTGDIAKVPAADETDILSWITKQKG